MRDYSETPLADRELFINDMVCVAATIGGIILLVAFLGPPIMIWRAVLR